MRDRSKSTMEDDSISSANGSVTGEPEISPEKEAANGAESNAESEDIFPTKKATDDKENKDGDSESSETPAKASRASKSKAKKESKPKKEKVKELPKRKSGRPTKKVQLESKNEESDEEEYEVEKILNSKKIRGKRHFLIKWKGFGASSNTWEPESTVSCPELISEYEERTDKTVEDDSEEEEERKSTPSKLKRGRPSSTKKGSPAKKAKATAKKGRSKPKKEFDYENADEDAEYDVEKILEVHTKKNGKREFLIHWKGWSTKHDSWEPEEHLYCEDLIKKFLTKVAQARSVEPKELRVAPETTRRFTLSQRSAGRRLSKRANHKQRVRYDDTE